MDDKKQNKTTHVFRGKTTAEALSKAKHELGNDILVVKRRETRQQNLLSILSAGKLGGDSLEVELGVKKAAGRAPAEAAAANPQLRAYDKARQYREKHSREELEKMAAAAAHHVEVGEAAAGVASQLDDLRRAIAENRREMERNHRESGGKMGELLDILSLNARGGMPAVSPELLILCRDLMARGVSERLAREIVEEIQDEIRREAGGGPGPEERLGKCVARRLPVASSINIMRRGSPTVVAMAGSSGVGKSTSVAKLAIHLGVKGKRKVGIVNEDMRRPGADGQLNNLGRIFGLPVVTAGGAAEMRDAVRSLAGCDLVLIDTAGRSPRNESGIAELAEILRAANADETHLLLSSTASETMLAESAARFRPIGFNRVVFTKLDECFHHGGILNAAAGLPVGLSYVTHGADYASPIRPAESDWLADLILGREDMDAGSDDGRRSGGDGGNPA